MRFGIRLGLAVKTILVSIRLVIHMLLHIIELTTHLLRDPEYGDHQLKNYFVKNICSQCKKNKS